MDTAFILSIILLWCCGQIKVCEAAAVVVSPSEIAPVCNGEQVKLMCTVTGNYLEWSFTLISGVNNNIRYSRVLSTSSGSSSLFINNITFTFSRESVRYRAPLVSSLLISSASDAINGTEVYCTDRDTGISLSTIIHIIKENPNQDPQFPIILLPETFERDGIVVSLDWIPWNYYSYDVNVIPQVKFRHIDNITIRGQLKVSYNTFYNISVTASLPCGQARVTNFIELYYVKCRNPANQINDSSIKVMGYRNPAVEDTTITFVCPPGLILTEPNTSTCMENGEWKPDPQNVECKVNMMDVGLLNHIKIIVTSVSALAVSAGFLFILTFCLCFCFHQKRDETTCVPEKEASPQYEEIQQQHHNHNNLDMNNNLAYAAIKI